MDINPGDRESECLGAMEPIGVELKAGDYVITHQCIKCGFVRKNKTTKDDDFGVVLELSSNNIL